VDKTDVARKFRGALLGMAVGDALGRPADGMSPYEALRSYQFIDAFFPDKGRGVEAGSFSGTAHLSLLAAAAICSSGGIDAGLACRKYASAKMRELDPSSARAVERLREGVAPEDAAPPSATASFLPRMIPAGLWASLARPRMGAEFLRACLSLSLPTHPGKESAVAGYAVARVVCECARGDSLDSPRLMYAGEDSLLARVTSAVRRAEDNLEGGGDGLWMRLAEISGRLQRGSSPEEVCAIFGNDDAAASMVPTALFCFMRGPDDMRSVSRAAGLGGEASVGASLVGGMCGAFAGDDFVSEGLVQGLEGAGKIAALGDKLVDSLWSPVGSSQEG
jgi:ADP-ribosylglycohydrolase